MARVYVIENPVAKVLYTVDHAVGRGGANRRDDVLLVQFFLKVISESKAIYKPAGQPPITCDGQWGKISQAYLNEFILVNSGVNPGQPLTADGRVDPVVGGKFTGAISGNMYTILALNRVYQHSRTNQALDDITKDPLFPADLRPSIKIQ